MKTNFRRRQGTLLLLVCLVLSLLSSCGGSDGRIKTDENGFYDYDGYIIKSDYPLDEDSLQKAAGKMQKIYEKYLQNKEINAYFAIVPDKNAYAAGAEDKCSVQIMDYAALTEQMQAQTEFLQYIEISDLLDLTDYYKTDAHWRQEKITDVASRLAEAMDAEVGTDYEEYEEIVASENFVGAYGRQSELDMSGEKLTYLNTAEFADCKVTDCETGSEIAFYDESKATSEENDGYDLFLYGSKSLITIENPNADTEKELILFRDSFGSSIAPLFAESYAKITLIDIRYLPSETLDRFVEFKDGQDVLFLFSTPVLNNSVTMK